jgi:hypothetical protein
MVIESLQVICGIAAIIFLMYRYYTQSHYNNTFL